MRVSIPARRFYRLPEFVVGVTVKNKSELGDLVDSLQTAEYEWESGREKYKL